MTKIPFIVAGSPRFARELARDVLSSPPLEDATLALMDTDLERLGFALRWVWRIVDLGPTRQRRGDVGPLRGARGGRRGAVHDAGGQH